MKLSKRRHSGFSSLKRGVLSYRYIKRNLFVASAVLASAAGIGAVVKYGEALDHTAEYEAANTVYEVVEIATEEITEEETEEITEDSDADIAVEDDDIAATTEEASEFDGKFVAKVTDTLNVRSEASSDADIVGKLFDGNVGDILEEDGDWVEISSGDVIGYVSCEYILTGTEAEEYAADYVELLGTVTDETVRVRAEASTSSDILELVSEGTVLTVTDQDDEWVQVSLNDETTGYISSDYISVAETYEYAMTIDDYTVMLAAEETEEVQLASTDSSAEVMSTDETDTSSNASSSGSSSSSTSSSSSSSSTASSSTTENKTTTEETATEEETSESSGQTDASSYSDSYLLACLVSMEAGSESYEGQLAVANVVINRLNSGKWGSSIYSVIYASGQFPSVTGSTMQYYLDNGPISSAQKAANEALAGNNNIGSYMSFLNVNYIDTDSLSDYTIIGNHCFY